MMLSKAKFKWNIDQGGGPQCSHKNKNKVSPNDTGQGISVAIQ